jgi:hypothetical protein
MATGFFARQDEQGDWIQVPQEESTHFWGGRGFVPNSGGGTASPSDPSMPSRNVPTSAQMMAASAPTGLMAPQPAAQPMGPPPIFTGSLSAGDPEQYVDAIRQMLISQIIPARQGALLGTLGALQRPANASPQAVLEQTAGQFNPMVRQAQTQQQQASQQLGPSGGRQAQRGQGQVQDNLLQQLAQLFSGVPGKANQTLYGLSSGSSFFLPQQPVATSTLTRDAPYDVQGTQQSILGLTMLGRQLAPLFMGGPSYQSSLSPMTAPSNFMGATPAGTDFTGFLPSDFVAPSGA